MKGEEIVAADVAASFQQAVLDVLVVLHVMVTRPKLINMVVQVLKLVVLIITLIIAVQEVAIALNMTHL